MYVHKITNNKDDSLNNLFSISSISIINISKVKEVIQNNLSKYKNLILLKLIYKYKKVF